MGPTSREGAGMCRCGVVTLFQVSVSEDRVVCYLQCTQSTVFHFISFYQGHMVIEKLAR